MAPRSDPPTMPPESPALPDPLSAAPESLERDRSRYSASSADADTEAALRRLRARLGEEGRGPARLRSWPTSWRRALALGWVVGWTVLGGTGGPRGDWAGLGWVGNGFALLLITVLGGMTWRAMRPAYRPPAGLGWEVLAAAGVVGFAALGFWDGAPGLRGEGLDSWALILHCAVPGILTTVAVVAGLLLLDRRQEASSTAALALAAGASAGLARWLACPVAESWHHLLSHGLFAGLGWALVALLTLRARRLDLPPVAG